MDLIDLIERERQKPYIVERKLREILPLHQNMSGRLRDYNESLSYLNKTSVLLGKTLLADGVVECGDKVFFHIGGDTYFIAEGESGFYFYKIVDYHAKFWSEDEGATEKDVDDTNFSPECKVFTEACQRAYCLISGKSFTSVLVSGVQLAYLISENLLKIGERG